MKVYKKYKGSNNKRLWAINILSPFFITRFKEEPLQTTKCPHLYLPKWLNNVEKKRNPKNRLGEWPEKEISGPIVYPGYSCVAVLSLQWHTHLNGKRNFRAIQTVVGFKLHPHNFSTLYHENKRIRNIRFVSIWCLRVKEQLF